MCVPTIEYTLESLSELPSFPPFYAVLGNPIHHSLSPVLQQAAFDHHGMNARYIRIQIEPERLPALVQKLRDFPFKGWNCTIPHKFSMLNLVDECHESARCFSAVNTVLNLKGHLMGFNTDGIGWTRAIQEDFGKVVRNLRILVLGTGGAGRAIATQATIEKCRRLVLVNRSSEKASLLAAELTARYPDETSDPTRENPIAIPWDETLLRQELKNIDLLVNATSVGLHPGDPATIPGQLLHPNLLVYDTIYKPAKTRLLQEAEKSGAKIANGLSMLLHQGAQAFRLWTGKEPPLKVMKNALTEAMQSGN